MNIHERNLNKRMNYVTTQLQLLLKKEIERNKQLDKERVEREAKDEKERIQRDKERVEREVKDEKERIQRDKERAERDKERIERDKELVEWKKEHIERHKELVEWEKEHIERHKELVEWEKERIQLYLKSLNEREELYRLERKEAAKKMDRSFARLNKIVSDYGLSHGNEAEFSFKLAIKRQKLLCGGIQFNEMKSNIKKIREYDIILINGSYVALVEVKRKASIRDVTKLVQKQAVTFREEFPQYKDKILVCFLAAYVAVDKVVEKANQFGVGVLLQDGFDIQEVVPVLKEF